MSLQGKTVLVTGGSRGIGKAISLACARAGARVVFCHPGDSEAEATLAELSALGPALSVVADVSVEGDVIALFDAAEKAFGPPDIVMSNAGILREAPIAETDIADFDRVVAVNLRGSFLIAREAARRMVEGRLIMIASDLGYLGAPGLAAYAASKGGVIALTRSLARELAPKILVNAIAPGAVATDMTSPASMSPEAIARDLDTPLGRYGQPEEVAALAVFLAGPEAGFVTGQCYGVNGGSAMY